MTHVEGSFLSQFVVSVEESWESCEDQTLSSLLLTPDWIPQAQFLWYSACEVAVDDEIPELAKVALSMDRPKNERCSPGIVGPPMPNIKQALSRTTQATTKCSNRSAWSSKFILAPKLNQTTTPKSAFYFCPIYCPTGNPLIPNCTIKFHSDSLASRGPFEYTTNHHVTSAFLPDS
ncbi:hypothetical protein MRB53_030575 [Persea americana]|uniref:Uncharacterized protein n=1 Tax=Persea americana TaxID=3435 RepID=A0ACC2KLK8_PERAE|nr:hypothetical protein MRB53_030575 [Persea americana]